MQLTSLTLWYAYYFTAVKGAWLIIGKTTKSVRNRNFSLKTFLTLFLKNKKWECFHIRYIGGAKHKEQNYVAFF